MNTSRGSMGTFSSRVVVRIAAQDWCDRYAEPSGPYPATASSGRFLVQCPSPSPWLVRPSHPPPEPAAHTPPRPIDGLSGPYPRGSTPLGVVVCTLPRILVKNPSLS